MIRLKQLVPRTYRTTYGADVTPENPTGTPTFCVWKMWLGRSYKIDRVRVAA